MTQSSAQQVDATRCNKVFSDPSAADLKAMIDVAPALISFFDSDHYCRYANAHHLEWYGMGSEAMIGLHMRELLGDEGYASRRPYLEGVAAGIPQAFDAKVPQADGVWREAAIRYVPRRAAQGVDGFYILVFDVARRKRELVEMLDQAHDAILVHNLQSGVITFWNRSSEALYGISREQAEGRPIDFVIPTAIEIAYDYAPQRLLDTGSWEGEVTRRRANGSEGIISVRWSLRRDEHGAPLEVFETGRDVTEERAAQEALSRSQADLAHAARVATLGQLTASIAHEVNQPLAAVVTNGEAGLRWLRRNEPELAEVESAIRRTITEAERASHIVSRIRSLVRRGELAMGAVDVNALVNDTASLLRRELAAAEVRLSIDMPPDLPPVHGDMVQLQQVLINLGLNAIQAMVSAGSSNRCLAIIATATPVGLLLEVRDSGPGLTAEVEKRLFEAFFTTKPSGMGLGLSVSRSIIERHGGNLWTERLAESCGACFRMTLLTHTSVQVRHRPL